MLIKLSHAPRTTQVDTSNTQITAGIDMGGDLWAADLYFHDSGKHRKLTFKGQGKELACYNELDRWKRAGYHIHVIYEAGRYGFTPARLLEHFGMACTIVPMNKLEIVKSGKRAKTDRLDAALLSQIDPHAPQLPKVYVPTGGEEVDRGMVKEEKRLDKDHQRKNNALLAILDRWYIGMQLPDHKHHKSDDWRKWISQNRNRKSDDVKRLPDEEYYRIESLIEELELLERQIEKWQERIVEREQQKRQDAEATGETYVADILMQFKGIGDRAARLVTWRIGNFDRFRNGKAISSYVGLVPMPWHSGKMKRDQGISKTGDRDLRAMLVEMAWLWRRWQPQSALAKKYEARLNKKGRTRRVAIVAMARQLLVALFRHITKGEPIEGAIINRALP